MTNDERSGGRRDPAAARVPSVSTAWIAVPEHVSVRIGAAPDAPPEILLMLAISNGTHAQLALTLAEVRHMIDLANTAMDAGDDRPN